MSNYARYKEWWMKHQAPHEIPSLYYGDTPESAFKQHIKDMSLYKLMETLEAWEEEEVPVQETEKMTEPCVKKPNIPELTEELNRLGELYKLGQLPSFPRPYIKYPTEDDPKPKCQKCGISLGGVMGYVCNYAQCPTFMKVTC